MVPNDDFTWGYGDMNLLSTHMNLLSTQGWCHPASSPQESRCLIIGLFSRFSRLAFKERERCVAGEQCRTGESAGVVRQGSEPVEGPSGGAWRLRMYPAVSHVKWAGSCLGWPGMAVAVEYRCLRITGSLHLLRAVVGGWSDPCRYWRSFVRYRW